MGNEKAHLIKMGSMETAKKHEKKTKRSKMKNSKKSANTPSIGNALTQKNHRQPHFSSTVPTRIIS